MGDTSRRKFIKEAAGYLAFLPLLDNLNNQDGVPVRNTILLRSGWSTDNWGDLVTIPAIYRLIQRYVVNTEVILWPYTINQNLENLLSQNFSAIKIVKGDIGEDGLPDTQELKDAFEKSDLLLYSPGAQRIIDWKNDNSAGTETRSLKYCRESNHPYAIFGFGDLSSDEDTMWNVFKETVAHAAIIFSTNSKTDDLLKNKKIKLKNLISASDPLISFNMRDEGPARNYLNGSGLLEKQFIIANIKTDGMKDEKINSIADKVKILIEKWIRDTGNPALIISDCESDIPHNRTLLYEHVSDDLKDKLYFYDGLMQPEVAESLFEKARVVTGMSPQLIFMGIQAGSPVFHYMDWDQGNKSQCLLDLGMKDSVMDLNSTSADALYKKLITIHRSFVESLLESSKAEKDVLKVLEDNFREISKIQNKLSPRKKKKKSGKD